MPYISLLNIPLSTLQVAFNGRTNRKTVFLGALLLIVSIKTLAFLLLVTGGICGKKQQDHD